MTTVTDAPAKPVPFTVLALLERSRDLIESGWTQGPYAVDAAGRTTAPTDERAVKFCAIGSMERAAWELHGKQPGWEANHYRVYDQADNTLRRTVARITGYRKNSETGTRSYVEYNEQHDRKKEDVIALYTQAIEAERARLEKNRAKRAGVVTPSQEA